MLIFAGCYGGLLPRVQLKAGLNNNVSLRKVFNGGGAELA